MLSRNAVLLSEVQSAAFIQPMPFAAPPSYDVLELVTDGYLLLNSEFCVTYASHKAELWLNQEHLALLGEHYSQFIPKPVARQLAINERDFIELPVVSEARWLHSSFETCLKIRLSAYHDGWVLSFNEENLSLSPALASMMQDTKIPARELAIADGVAPSSAIASAMTGLSEVSTTRDSTHQPLSNELRQLIYAAEEAERCYLARELHDVLGQYVTAIRFGLENLAHEIDEYAEEVTSLVKIRSLVEQFDQEFHYVALKLRPPALGNGLKAAIVQYALEWGERSGIHVDLHSFESKIELSTEVETNLYRILQEALNNIQKYAKARRVSVILEIRHGQLLMIVEDDGVGFNLEALHQSKDSLRKIGLSSMRERAGLAGGSCEIESNIGQGTTVIVRMPLK